jgi:hypothetical protein
LCTPTYTVPYDPFCNSLTRVYLSSKEKEEEEEEGGGAGGVVVVVVV